MINFPLIYVMGKIDFRALEEGVRFIYRRNYSSTLHEDDLEERSPSGDYLKFRSLGWLSLKEASSHYTLVEVLGKSKEVLGNSKEVDDMCPNCVTPWKCNGPHLNPCRNAPGGSPQLERYLDALELSKYGERPGDA